MHSRPLPAGVGWWECVDAPVLTEGVSSRFQQVHSPRGGQGDDGVAREPLPPSRRALPPSPPSREEERMVRFLEEMTVVEPVELC